MSREPVAERPARRSFSGRGPAAAGAAPAGVVAGLEVHVEPVGLELPRHGYTDGRVYVRLIDGPLPRLGRQWLAASPPCALPSAIAPDGRRIVIAEAAAAGHDLAAAVRCLVPFASALQGKVVLHAAGLEAGGTAVAVLGASGAGKSTLARAAAALGVRVLSDDLLPCRVADDRVVVPAIGDAGEVEQLPLARVIALDRSLTIAAPAARRLAPRDALALLIRQGFGELAAQAAWAAQFDIYHRVAASLPVLEVVIPDDLERVGDAAAWIIAGAGTPP